MRYLLLLCLLILLGATFPQEIRHPSASAATVLSVPAGAEWRYFKGITAPPADWPAKGFNDAAWPVGPSGFGYGDGDDATVLTDMRYNYVSLYVRHTFSVTDPGAISKLTLSVDYDDGFVAYLNGVEVARGNVSGNPPAYDIGANSDREASGGDTSPQPLAVFDISNWIALLVPGANLLAVQGHNVKLSSSDFSLIPTLTGSGEDSPTPTSTATAGPTPTPPPPPSAAPLPILPGAEWRYTKGSAEPPAMWASKDFDDSTWATGSSGFGYGDGDDATVLTDMKGGYVSLYIRRAFTVDDPGAITQLVLSVDYDDSFVAYINGTEVARANVNGSPPKYMAVANADHEASLGDLDPQPVGVFDLSFFINSLARGYNVLAIQGHNRSKTSSDFSLIPSLEAFAPEPPAPPEPLPILPGAEWRYFRGRSEPPSNWKSVTFDDSAWWKGPSGFGYADNDDGTLLSDMQYNYLSVYIRKTFTVDDPTIYHRLVFSIDYDDGYVAYLNGKEISRALVSGSPPGYDSPATAEHESTRGDTQPQPEPEKVDITRFLPLLKPGNNVLAIQGHNVKLDSSDFSLIPALEAIEPPPASFEVRPGAIWRYAKGTAAPPAAWKERGFNDSSWLSGPSGFGFGDNDDATVLEDMRNNYISLFTRHTFSLFDPSAIKGLTLSVDYDDGFVAYLNGVEVARANVSGSPPAYNAPATRDHEAFSGDSNPQPIGRYNISSLIPLLVPGDNVLAVEVHNVSLGSGDLTIVPSLAGTSTPSTFTLARHPYLQDPTSSRMTILWTTSEQGIPSVRYVREGSATPSIKKGSSRWFSALGGYYQHEVTVSGLASNTRYSYQVLMDGTELAGGSGAFRTALPKGATSSVTFAAFGDSGTGSPGQRAVRDQLARDSFDFALVLGDVAQGVGSYGEYENYFFRVYRDLVRNIPFIPLIGNHDNITNLGRPFLDVFDLPRNGSSGRIERYFSFDYGNAHFVVLDTSLVDQIMADWLNADLAATTQQWTIVAMHWQAFGEGSDHPITESTATQIRSLLSPIFQTYGVDLVLNGNNAMYGRSVPLTDAQPAWPYATATTVEAGGVVYVTAGGGGDWELDPAYKDSFHQAPDGATFSAYHYVKVTISGCVLMLQAVDAAGQVRDTYTISHC